MSEDTRSYAKSVGLEQDIYGFIDNNDKNFDDFINQGLAKAQDIINSNKNISRESN